MKKKGVDFQMVYLYVDDLIYTKTSKDMVAKFKDAMMKEFKMSPWIDEIFYWHSNEAISREKFYFSRKVCCKSFQEIRLVKM